MSASPLCQLSVQLTESTANISSVFLGWILPGTDLPPLLQPTANTKGISNPLTFGNLSISQTKPTILGFPFLFWLICFRTYKCTKHSDIHCHQCPAPGGWTEDGPRKALRSGRMHSFPEASFPGCGTQWWHWATWEGHRASSELGACNSGWSRGINPITESSFEAPALVAMASKAIKGPGKVLMCISQGVSALKSEKSHEFYSVFLKVYLATSGKHLMFRNSSACTSPLAKAKPVTESHLRRKKMIMMERN